MNLDLFWLLTTYFQLLINFTSGRVQSPKSDGLERRKIGAMTNNIRCRKVKVDS